MKSKKYLPKNEAELAQWCTNFNAQFAAQAEILGFSDTEKQAVAAVCTGINTAIDDCKTAKISYEKQVSTKNQTLSGNIGSIREMVRRIKAAPAYTEAIGKLLGIIGAGSSFDPSTAVPIITLAKSATGYDFKFSLLDYFDAVAVFRRQPGESDFSKVDIDMKSPYPVASPIENGTEYYFQYLKNDVLTGLPSDIIPLKL